MSNVFTIILIAVGYGLWKVLDHFQLPNTFSILLIIFTALSGAVWCYLRFGVLPKRARQIARLEQRSGKPLNDEEKTQIEPISGISFCIDCALIYFRAISNPLFFHGTHIAYWRFHLSQ